jgi:hypothetical protein
MAREAGYIELAKEAGWEYADDDRGFEPLWHFAALVAAAEREACAKVCDKFNFGQAPKMIQDAIRARGQA